MYQSKSFYTVKNMEKEKLAGYESAPLENWYRYNYFKNEIDISGSGVEEYTFKEIQTIAGFSFDELDMKKVNDGPTIGSSRVRELLALKFGVGDPGMVITTNGANEALQLAIRSIMNVGDELIALEPSYHCHDKIAISMGCEVKKWNLSIEDGYRLDLDRLEEMVGDKTKALVLNFPHNPTGKSITQEELLAIIKIIERYDVYLLWDAAFQPLVYDSAPLVDPINCYDKTISIGTFSKFMGAPGLRFGWILGAYDVISRCVRQKDYGNLYVAPVIEFVSEKMLLSLEKFSIPRLHQAASNRKIVNNWIVGHSDHVSWTMPNGGVCGIMKIDKFDCVERFCIDFLDQYGVLLVPGSCFDLPHHVRVGFGGNTQQLKEGLDRLEQFMIGKILRR